MFPTRIRSERSIRVFLCGVVWAALSTWLPWPTVADLAPAIQADLYLVQTEEYLKEKNYPGASEAMEKLIKLAEEHKLTVPDAFHFKHAQVLNLSREYAEASAALHRYLESAGQAGEHYREALMLLHEVSSAEEQAQAAAAAERAAAEKAAAERAAAERAAAERAARAAAEKAAAERAAAEKAAAEKAAAERAAAERAARAAQEVARSMTMVTVPAGSYRMGSPASELTRYKSEGPIRRVTVAKPFAVGVHEVTFEEWDACVAAGGCGGYRPDDEGWGRGRRPVINVSWEDAQRFVAWLSEGTGETYRLLSEAEWEYVARAGTTTPFHTGATIATSQANYDGNYTYGSGRKGVYRAQTVAVGSFGPNAFGLYDVHGNVWEWVQDCWNDSYRGAPSDGSAWERGDCSRVVRGGSWDFAPRALRSAVRDRSVPGYRNSDFGFRVARTLDS